MSIKREFENFLVYSASAGSGKTFALSLRYISLLFLGESPSNILATTFTNKAVSEMKNRIRDYLLNLENESDFIELLSKEIGFSRDKILEKREEVLNRFLSSTTNIMTIDSFISSILRSNSLEIGLDPSFNIVDAVKDIEREFLEEIQGEGLMEDFILLTIKLSQKDLQDGINLMFELYQDDPILPNVESKALEIEDIEKNISELREIIYNLLKDLKMDERRLKTFNPTSSNIEEFIKKGVFKKDSLHNHKDYKKYVKQNSEIESLFKRLRGEIKRYFIAKESFILSKLFNLYSYYRNVRIMKAQFLSQVDFNDLKFFTYRLLYKTIKKEFLYFKLDSKFRHILLDEFQDTSVVQFLIFQPLIDEILSGFGQEEFRSFFYVGDPKQSLYRFRGGNETLFNWVAKKYRLKIKELDINYRSYKNIVESVNLWFNGVMPEFVPQKSKSKKVGYVAVYENSDIFDEAVNRAKKLIDEGINIDDITFLVVKNKDGIELQNRASKANIKTILQTTTKLNKLSKIVALVDACKYLYIKDESKLYNLMLRINEDSLENLNFDWFNLEMRPIDVLDNLIKRFDYFEDEVNILNLLEFASKYSELGDFIEEFEESKLPIATKSRFGATIMTIHSSKGLEFDYVIVLDKSSNSRNRFKLIKKYDENLNIERFFYRDSKREFFDDEYSKLMELEKQFQYKDELNKLYVALTRAKKGLIVIKKNKNSSFDILKNFKPFEIGNIEKSFKKEQKSIKKEYPEIRFYGLQNSSNKDKEREHNYYASLFGTALHFTLEMMKEFDEKSLNSAIKVLINSYGTLLKDEEILDIKNRVNFLIKNSDFLALLKGKKSIYQEQPISYRGELYKIDLLIEDKSIDEVVIVDYKSSKKDIYSGIEQVLNYCSIVESITKKRATGYLCFLLKDRVEIKKVTI